jgi:hypothetical protein
MLKMAFSISISIRFLYPRKIKDKIFLYITGRYSKKKNHTYVEQRVKGNPESLLRQSHFCVFLIDQNLSLEKKFPLMEIKSFLDKNLPLKNEDQMSSSQSGMKEAFNFYICDEQNGHSKDTFYSFR